MNSPEALIEDNLKEEQSTKTETATSEGSIAAMRENRKIDTQIRAESTQTLIKPRRLWKKGSTIKTRIKAEVKL